MAAGCTLTPYLPTPHGRIHLTCLHLDIYPQADDHHSHPPVDSVSSNVYTLNRASHSAHHRRSCWIDSTRIHQRVETAPSERGSRRDFSRTPSLNRNRAEQSSGSSIDNQSKYYRTKLSDEEKQAGWARWNWVALAVADLAGLLTAVISGVMMGELLIITRLHSYPANRMYRCPGLRCKIGNRVCGISLVGNLPGALGC